MSSKPEVELPNPRAFVYISAEDIYRPFISTKYIETKRRAELDIGNIVSSNPTFRGVYVRPGESILPLGPFSFALEPEDSRHRRPHIPPALPPAHFAAGCDLGSHSLTSSEGTDWPSYALTRAARPSSYDWFTAFLARASLAACLGRQCAEHPAHPCRPRRAGDRHCRRQLPRGRKRCSWRPRNAEPRRVGGRG